MVIELIPRKALFVANRAEALLADPTPSPTVSEFAVMPIGDQTSPELTNPLLLLPFTQLMPELVPLLHLASAQEALFVPSHGQLLLGRSRNLR